MRIGPFSFARTANSPVLGSNVSTLPLDLLRHASQFSSMSLEVPKRKVILSEWHNQAALQLHSIARATNISYLPVRCTTGFRRFPFQNGARAVQDRAFTPWVSVSFRPGAPVSSRYDSAAPPRSAFVNCNYPKISSFHFGRLFVGRVEPSAA